MQCFLSNLVYSFQLITAIYDTVAMRLSLGIKWCILYRIHFTFNRIERFSLECVALCVFRHRMGDVSFVGTCRANSRHPSPLRKELACSKNRRFERNWEIVATTELVYKAKRFFQFEQIPYFSLM